jgi:hypothetical protein
MQANCPEELHQKSVTMLTRCGSWGTPLKVWFRVFLFIARMD